MHVSSPRNYPSPLKRGYPENQTNLHTSPSSKKMRKQYGPDIEPQTQTHTVAEARFENVHLENPQRGQELLLEIRSPRKSDEKQWNAFVNEVWRMNIADVQVKPEKLSLQFLSSRVLEHLNIFISSYPAYFNENIFDELFNLINSIAQNVSVSDKLKGYFEGRPMLIVDNEQLEIGLFTKEYLFTFDTNHTNYIKAYRINHVISESMISGIKPNYISKVLPEIISDGINIDALTSMFSQCWPWKSFEREFNNLNPAMAIFIAISLWTEKNEVGSIFDGFFQTFQWNNHFKMWCLDKYEEYCIKANPCEILNLDILFSKADILYKGLCVQSPNVS